MLYEIEFKLKVSMKFVTNCFRWNNYFRIVFRGSLFENFHVWFHLGFARMTNEELGFDYVSNWTESRARVYVKCLIEFGSFFAVRLTRTRLPDPIRP